MIDFSKPPCIYWSNTAKISYLQRRIIVWSIMYYVLNESCVSDFQYDSVSHQLVELQKIASKEEFENSRYYYAMRDFEGSTGFDIPSRLTKEDLKYLEHIALIVSSQYKQENKVKGAKDAKVKRFKK